ncbi:class I SAM-dependent methyltransferase [Enterococcus sp. LJL128]
MTKRQVKDYRLPQAYEKGNGNIWTDSYISQQLLTAHLDPDFDGASRKAAFIDASADWIEKEFPVKQFSKVIDFGCGPGLYAERLAKREYQVTGIDFSRRSITKGQRRAEEQRLGIKYIQANYLEWQPSTAYDLALFIYCDYGALNEEERRKILAVIFDSLNEGGQLLMDNFTINQLAEVQEESQWSYWGESSFWSDGEHIVLSRTKKYSGNLVLDQAIVNTNEQQKIYNIWKYFSTRETLLGELEAAGFVVREFYENVAGAPFNVNSETVAVIAEKPGSLD